MDANVGRLRTTPSGKRLIGSVAKEFGVRVRWAWVAGRLCLVCCHKTRVNVVTLLTERLRCDLARSR